MKTNKIRYILIVSLVLMYFSCRDESTLPYPNINEHVGAVTNIEGNPDKNFFNALNDLAAEEVEFTIDVNGFNITEVSSVDLELVFTQLGVLLDLEGNPRDSVWAPVLITTINTFPSTVNITGQQVADILGIDVDDFAVGDSFQLTFPINTADGRRLTVALNSDLCNEPVQPSFGGCSFLWGISCPSEIPAGTWDVYVVASDVTYGVEITADGAGFYSIANFNLDYQPPFYDTFNNLPISGGFTDVCNTIYLNKVGTYGVQWTGVGTYDPANQTITFAEISDPGYGQGPWDNSGSGYVLTYNPN